MLDALLGRRTLETSTPSAMVGEAVPALVQREAPKEAATDGEQSTEVQSPPDSDSPFSRI